jgi:hypothetical protein
MISLMKDAHNGMSDAFRALLESKGYTIYYHAPTVIMIAGKTGSRFREIDCSLCAENMMLAAYALGIGSCCVGSRKWGMTTKNSWQGSGYPKDTARSARSSSDIPRRSLKPTTSTPRR